MRIQESTRKNYKLVKKTKKIKVFILPKKTVFQKIPYNLLFIFFQIDTFQYTYIFTKCIDNFKFSTSLKSYEE